MPVVLPLLFSFFYEVVNVTFTSNEEEIYVKKKKMKYKYGLLFIIERKGGKKKQTSLSVAEKKQKHAYRLMRAKRLT